MVSRVPRGVCPVPSQFFGAGKPTGTPSRATTIWATSACLVRLAPARISLYGLDREYIGLHWLVRAGPGSQWA